MFLACSFPELELGHFEFVFLGFFGRTGEIDTSILSERNGLVEGVGMR
jgi:hypothetical protein